MHWVGERDTGAGVTNQIRILVVEDESVVSKDIQESLKGLGYGVCGTASAGEEAIRKAESLQPDLVLMDIVLKGDIDGVEAAETIRSKFHIPVIYLTAYSDEYTLNRAKVTEPSGYILKPFDERELHTTIEVAMYRHTMQKRLKESERWFGTTLRSIGDAVIATNTQGRITFMNPVAEVLTGWKLPEALDKDLSEVFSVRDEDGCILLKNPVAKVLEEGLVIDLRNNILIGKDGSKLIVDDSAAPIVDDNGTIVGAVLVFRDVSERQKAEQKRTKMNSLLMAVRNMNESLLRVKSEPELFQQICESLVTVEDFKLVTISLLDKDRYEIRPVAHAGSADGFLIFCTLSWDELAAGRGPTGTAISTGAPCVVNDTQHDPSYAPWKAEAMNRGFRSTIALPLVSNGEVMGSLEVYSGEKDSFGAEEIEFLMEAAGDITVALKSLRLETELATSLQGMKKALTQTVEAIACMSEMRDPYTAGHQRRVAKLASAVAQEMGMSEDQIEGIRVSGFLHDVGKIVVPAEILSKPGRINDAELSLIRTHSSVGYEILKLLEFPWPVAKAVLQHHERRNGSGYPAGLTAEALTVEAEILAVADVVESMASRRPYREALGIDKALEEISEKKGILYSPQVVDACLRLFRQRGFTFDEKG
ncbi:MAG TPA: HD domain-containing phosphohydrolase [Syntrophorhabdales bacterium]|nr:HD domain-containing phosphohydrolase [Syntrophorhabdales bacterium]